MLIPIYERRFKKDIDLMKKRGFDYKEFEILTFLLLSGKPLPEKYKDHKLKGNLIGYRDCHVKNDILLIYKKTQTHIIFSRIGTHSDIF